MTLTDDQTTDLLLAMEDRLNSHRSRILDADNEDGPDREHSIRRAQNDVAAAQALCDILEDAAEIHILSYEELASTAGTITSTDPKARCSK